MNKNVMLKKINKYCSLCIHNYSCSDVFTVVDSVMNVFVYLQFTLVVNRIRRAAEGV